VLICIFIIYLIKFQFHNIQKLQLHQIDEFIALSRAYKGEDVPIKDGVAEVDVDIPNK
jgi:hypothetical protein